MINNDYSPSLVSAIKLAQSMARQERQSTYGVPHLVLAMLTESTGLKEILQSMQKDVAYLMDWFDTRKEMYTSSESDSDEICADDELSKVLDEAERSKIKLGSDHIDALCVFTAISREGVIYSHQQIELLGVSEEDILKYYDALTPAYSFQGEENQILASFPYAENLKTEATIKNGSIVVGRDKEIRTMLECLERSENKAIMIIGDSGIGKTSIINAFVKEICYNKDEMLQQVSVVGMNTAKLLAGTSSENEISQKTVALIHKLKQIEQVVLVIDDLQVLLENGNTGKSTTLINILNAQIGEGACNLIFTITKDAYRKHIEKQSIESKLVVINAEELDYSTLLCALHLHKKEIESHYGLEISEDCIPNVIQLSRRYFKERSLPSAAIDLLDRTSAAVRLCNKNARNTIENIRAEFERLQENTEETIQNSDLQLLYRMIFNKIGSVITSKLSDTYTWNDEDKYEVKIHWINKILKELENLSLRTIGTVTAAEIEAIVAECTNIPIGKIQAREKDRLLGIESKLRERVKGQDKAIATLSDAIIESRSGLSDPQKPIGSFFFLGPTGTGKTELTKSLAELLFDNESAMIRFDMSEFKEEHSAALLYGAPPGYVGYEEGGLLVTQIRQKPYSVVLFDEIEKAHSSVYDVFLQMMDEGKIHDKLGREGDFSNSIIIFTSNIGSQWIVDQIQAGHTPTSAKLIEVMAQYFRPEFLGRLTEVVPFSPINENVAKEIFLLHFSRLKKQLLEQKNINLELAEETLQYLSQKGFSPKYGARPIAGVIRTYIKKTVSRLIVSEEIKPGDNIVVNLRNNELVWELQ
ncbi:AAA family ATPase [Bacteroides ovatus]|uniref:AAA family ATPase n=1 Tax=Bacteroides ovatus TaxID=28116 RepID=UPI00189ED58B|nr:ATP-dependent Clp protease ATP-binding subunit [Bacteroides ovatus]MDC2664683.1 ATP-dependent Clp protease ATP-binding subunit [Bacteroides ovatus]